MSLKSFKFSVPENFDQKDLKTFLRRGCGLSAHILTLAKQQENGITDHGKVVRTVDKVRSGDEIILTLPEDKNEIIPVEGVLSVLYEDEYILIANKPANMPVHPTKKHQRDTLANVNAFYQRNRGENYAFRALNRLDKDTTGCVVLAKDLVTHCLLNGGVKKEYIAFCEGIISECGTIDTPITLAENSTMKRMVRPDGAKAVTHYRPVLHGKDFTAVKLRLETGRTHQIRCHMSAIGHPLLGDELYGGTSEKISRQALHCVSVSFRHPFTKSEILIHAKLPSDMSELIQQAKVL